MEFNAGVRQRWKRTITVLLVIFMVGFAGAAGWLGHQQSLHRSWYSRVEFLILQLARKKPRDFSPAQWAQCLTNTWNLHMNHGTPDSFPVDSREEFAAGFERRLYGPVKLDAIDWIWDEYERIVPRARRYDHYRPTTQAMLDQAAKLERNSNTETLNSWVERLEERERLRREADLSD